MEKEFIIVNLIIILFGVGMLIGSIYEIKATQRSLNDLRNWSSVQCKVYNVSCGKDEDSYIDHCKVEGYYSSVDVVGNVVNFTLEEFGEDESTTDILSSYAAGNTFTCYFSKEDNEDVTIDPPTLSIHFLIYEYLFSAFLAVIIGYVLKYLMYIRYESNFVPAMGWRTYVENIWERSNKENKLFPFGHLIFLDLIFCVIIFFWLAMANLSSLNYIYGFIPLLLLGILGSFEKYSDPNIFVRPAAKVHYILANYAFAFAWSLVNIISRISLLFADPFRDGVTYAFSIILFLGYFAVKVYYFKQAANLFRVYYSNTTVEEAQAKSS